jgi:hypothetical protein
MTRAINRMIDSMSMNLRETACAHSFQSRSAGSRIGPRRIGFDSRCSQGFPISAEKGGLEGRVEVDHGCWLFSGHRLWHLAGQRAFTHYIRFGARELAHVELRPAIQGVPSPINTGSDQECRAHQQASGAAADPRRGADRWNLCQTYVWLVKEQ